MGIILKDGREWDATVILGNADPFRLRTLVGASHFPSAFNAKLDGFRRMGTTLKIECYIPTAVHRTLRDDRGRHSADRSDIATTSRSHWRRATTIRASSDTNRGIGRGRPATHSPDHFGRFWRVW